MTNEPQENKPYLKENESGRKIGQSVAEQMRKLREQQEKEKTNE